jgi:ATP-dependent DNA helicase 2 subunit 2
MADKQATIYVIDLGCSTAECHNGRVESDLDYGMRYIWDKIANTMAADRKTWSIGILGFRTDETNGPLAADEGYENISVSVSLL